MNLRIENIVDHKQQNERVEFIAVDNCELSYFMLSDTTFQPNNKISNKLRHLHWFYPQKLNKGDRVILYTKQGVDRSERIGQTGNTLYTRYWGLDSCVWNDDGDAALLFQVNSWNSYRTR